LKEDEWEGCGEWMWENRKDYTGISVLPYSDHSYQQAPFENCSEETYNEMFKLLKSIDLTKVIERDDLTEQKEQAACSGGSCDLVM
jgi:ribonucleoside-diphosphate reductase alpha chain